MIDVDDGLETGNDSVCVVDGNGGFGVPASVCIRVNYMSFRPFRLFGESFRLCVSDNRLNEDEGTSGCEGRDEGTVISDHCCRCILDTDCWYCDLRTETNGRTLLEPIGVTVSKIHNNGNQ